MGINGQIVNMIFLKLKIVKMSINRQIYSYACNSLFYRIAITTDFAQAK